MQLAVDLIEK